MILHLLRYRASGGREAELDGFIRSSALPALLALEGLAAIYVGRRLGREGQDHVVVSVWRTARAHADALTGDLPGPLAGRADLLREARAETYDSPVAISRPGVPRILRIARGGLDAPGQGGEGPAAADAVAASSAIASIGGCVAAHPGLAPGGTAEAPARVSVVLVSVWASWEELLAGGEGRPGGGPLATDYAGILGPRPSIEHYELLERDEASPPPGGRRAERR